MKRLYFIPLFAMFAVVFILSKAEKVPMPDYKAVYMKREGLEKSVTYIDGAREMINPGKIYVRGNTIYINDKYKGVHIIDNSNPASPKQTGYITAPGCVDMAVKGDVIYLDNAVDFVTFNMQTKKETKRIKNYFPPHYTAPDGMRDNKCPAGYIIVEWKLTH